MTSILTAVGPFATGLRSSDSEDRALGKVDEASSATVQSAGQTVNVAHRFDSYW